MAQRAISFITTANRDIGTGHLRRCLTLSDEVRGAGAQTAFFVYAGDDAVTGWLKDRADHYDVNANMALEEALAKACRWSRRLVIDSYDITARELEPRLQQSMEMLVMDDLADRPLPATWILNSCIPENSGMYKDLTSASLLLGPRHALLRAQFRDRARRAIRQKPGRVLVTFGGSDPLRQTERILGLLNEIPEPLEIRVVLGLMSSFEETERLTVKSHHQFTLLRDVKDMADHMTWADWAISGAGQTLFELAATGCPAVALQVADNQRFTGELFSHIGSAFVLDARKASDGQIRSTIKTLMGDAAQRERMGHAGQMAVDGRGAVRVAEKLLQEASIR